MKDCFCVFVVSLVDAKEKRACISKSLHAAGCTFDFIDAVDGRVNDLTKQRKKIPWCRKLWPKTTSTEIGCHLSHLKVYQRFLESSFEFCLIFEDDVSPVSDLVKKIEILIQENQETKGGNVFLLQGGVESTHKLLTSSYLLDRIAAKQILDFGCQFDFLADDWDLLEKKIKIHVQYTKNSMITGYLDSSEIGASRNMKWRKFKKTPKYLLFLLFHILPNKFRFF